MNLRYLIQSTHSWIRNENANHMQLTTPTNATFWDFEGPWYGKWTLLDQSLHL